MIVIPVGKLVQFAVTAGLVQVTELAPAGPVTGKVPVQAAPAVVIAFHVNVPVKLFVVVEPETLPLIEPPVTVQVPETVLPDCVRFIVIPTLKAPVVGCVPANVPVQFPATLAGDGVEGEPPQATAPNRDTIAQIFLIMRWMLAQPIKIRQVHYLNDYRIKAVDSARD